MCRSVVVVHDATRDTMAQDIFTGPDPMQKLAYGTLALSVIIADTFMVSVIVSQYHSWVDVDFSYFRFGDATFFGKRSGYW